MNETGLSRLRLVVRLRNVPESQSLTVDRQSTIVLMILLQREHSLGIFLADRLAQPRVLSLERSSMSEEFDYSK